MDPVCQDLPRSAFIALPYLCTYIIRHRDPHGDTHPSNSAATTRASSTLATNPAFCRFLVVVTTDPFPLKSQSPYMPISVDTHTPNARDPLARARMSAWGSAFTRFTSSAFAEQQTPPRPLPFVRCVDRRLAPDKVRSTMLCHTVDVTDVHGTNPRGHWVVHESTTYTTKRKPFS